MSVFFKAEMDDKGFVTCKVHGTGKELSEMFLTVFQESEQIADFLERVVDFRKTKKGNENKTKQKKRIGVTTSIAV